MGSYKIKDAIKELADQNCDQQRQGFEGLLDEHQKDSEQRDDITLVGIRI